MRLTAECAENFARYCRAWRRHGVHFGITGAHRRLEQYGAIFPVCCGTPESMPRDTEQPAMERVVLLSGDDSLVFRFPHGHPDRERRGRLHPGFLDAALFCRRYTRLFAAAPADTVFLITIPRIYVTEGMTPAEFTCRLALFLEALPQARRWAIEPENREFQTPAYGAMLRERGVIPVIRSGVPGPAPTEHEAIVRIGAEEEWDPAADIRALLCRRSDEASLTILLEDRTEVALMVFAGLMKDLNGELARRSVIRRRMPEGRAVTC